MTTVDTVEPIAQLAVTIDEQFRAWIDPRSNLQPPLLIVGAGLSSGLVPRANELATAICARKGEIEDELQIAAGPAIAPECESDLYAWAGHCIDELTAKHSHSDVTAKARLATAMGLTTDKRFLAQAGVGPRGSTPRHRALARLARENRIRAVWSFNWDCWLESSFDAVGLRRHDESSQRVANEGWKTRYRVWFKNEPAHNAIDTQLLFKAHGCVRALQEGQGDFVIAKSEMEAPQPDSKTTLLRKQIGADGGAIAIGWAAREPYVVNVFATQTPPAHAALQGGITFVDMADQADHQTIRRAYGAQAGNAAVAVKVNPDGPGQTDHLMLWLQTKRGIRSLHQTCSDQQSQRALLQIERQLPAFDDASMCSSWIASFFDDWLPVWLRCCYFTGAQKELGVVPGHEFNVLPSDRRDAHIHWSNPSTGRQDLQAAISLLLALSDPAQPHCPWLFDDFPGALWHPQNSHLILPVPIWADHQCAARATLKPLVESLHWAGKGRIETLTLLPLTPLGDTQPVDAPLRLQGWKEAVASCFNHAALADPTRILDCTLNALKAMYVKP